MTRCDGSLYNGQYENPASPWSSDQTRLFSQERWVSFAWTPEQIQQQLVDTIVLTGP